jgi:hypothetical protein
MIGELSQDKSNAMASVKNWLLVRYFIKFRTNHAYFGEGGFWWGLGFDLHSFAIMLSLSSVYTRSFFFTESLILGGVEVTNA